MTELLLSKPYRVVDFLPDQVPADGGGQFFAVERYFLRSPMRAGLRRRFMRILLKLNCYYDFRAGTPEEEERYALNPDPEKLASLIEQQREDLLILLPGENALITLNHDDAYMTVYNFSGTLLDRLERLAAAEGLFVRRPEQP